MPRISISKLVLVSIVAFVSVVCLAGAPAFAAPAGDPHAAQDGHAESGASHGGGDSHGGAASPIAAPKEAVASAVTALVVFGVVLFVLSTRIWPTITKGLDERNEKIREEIASAEAARAQAKAALDEYEQSLSQARVEAQKMLDETRTEQARLASELKAKADRDLSEMREKAKRDIENAKKAALGEIYSESVTLATRMAGKILQREVTAGDEKRMLEESLEELASTQN